MIFITSELIKEMKRFKFRLVDVTFRIVSKLQLGLAIYMKIKYEDENSFKFTFKYLNNMYFFNPRRIHLNNSYALKKLY